MTPARIERILAVDDDPGMRRVLSRTLAPPYQVELARTSAEARERLAGHRFDVALVDIQLEDGDGYHLCREIREKSPETDVILITGSHSEPDEKLYRSLEEGAFYFLLKPFERRVLRALVDRCLSLQRERRAKESYARELALDLERARRFQASLVPREPLRDFGWHVEGRLRSCEALGGDFFLSAPGPDGTLVFAIADVVGHGVRAAMYAGMLRSLLDSARRRDPDPARVQNELLSGIEVFEDESSATLVYGSLLPDGRLRYFNAGHPRPLIVRAAAELESLRTTTHLLNPLLPRGEGEVEEVRLVPGERLLAFTDGVYEAFDGSEREWGLDSLMRAILDTRDREPGDALDSILAGVDAHAAGRPLADDVTVLLVERTPSSPT
jgi:sigma-B regulation protein RsbU (phosphoserine phosphatase)